jgi:proline iminopeptidase
MDQVRADDGCRLWTAETGHGEPLIMCHGGPGLWDMTGSLAAALAGHQRIIRWDQRGCGRSERRGPYSVARCVADLDAVRAQTDAQKPALFGHSWGAALALRTQGQDREATILQWSTEFTDGREREHAEEMATPWFGVNWDCYRGICGELERTWHEDELIAECRELQVPVLIIDGERDLRPRWAVDSLERALPDVRRVVLPDAGHIPWLEKPGEFAGHLLGFLNQ